MNDVSGRTDEDDGADGSRFTENAVIAGFAIALMAAGIRPLGSLSDLRKAQDCAAQGRRNCAAIERPARSQ